MSAVHRHGRAAMKITQRSAFAKRLATNLYDGASPPLSVVKPADKHHEVDWWTSDNQNEGPDSLRHLAALALYLEVAKHSKIALPPQCFPASFDFDDEEMRPDKGVIKAFLEHRLIEPRMMVAQLVFDVTPDGQAYLARRSGDLKTGL
ncbi:hypothetical protein HFO69_26590 [Rhizobium laguerreae]|uniref:hypothetical protein n=1 Tax=Rhizobium laguerreae TaxID=1076926 RepID=UPI001C91F6C5|nr:hypothetical protein [Rhizobium laguerreae]MBY3101234.1 hypothetical protein [Rhizobium laguerreae]